MERDRRLTGMLRGQTDSPIAPDGFELSNAWKVRAASLALGYMDTDVLHHLDGEKDCIEHHGWQKEACTYSITCRNCGPESVSATDTQSKSFIKSGSAAYSC